MAKHERKKKKKKSDDDHKKKRGKKAKRKQRDKALKAKGARKAAKAEKAEPRAADDRDPREERYLDERRRGRREALPIADLKDRRDIPDPDESGDDVGEFVEFVERHGTPPQPRATAAKPAASSIEGATGMPVVSKGPSSQDPWWKEVDPAKRLTYPYCAIGQIITDYVDGPRNVHASAALVGRGLLVTAGHCVDHYDYGRAASIEFIPAYDKGAPKERPLGSWFSLSSDDIVPHPNWRSKNGAVNWRYDVGIIRLAPNEHRQLPGDICGSFAFDWPYTGRQEVDLYGYPERAGYGSSDPKLPKLDGGDLVQSRGRFQGRYPDYGPNGPVAVVSGFGKGASGGPWVTNIFPAQPGDAPPDTDARTNCIVGVNSFVDRDYPTRMFSPQLVNVTQFLNDAVRQDRLDHPRAKPA